MSRWLDSLPDGTYKEKIYDRDGCNRCEYFEKEDETE